MHRIIMQASHCPDFDSRWTHEHDFLNFERSYSRRSHPITCFKDDSAYVTTKTADRNQRSTEDG